MCFREDQEQKQNLVLRSQSLKGWDIFSFLWGSQNFFKIFFHGETKNNELNLLKNFIKSLKAVKNCQSEKWKNKSLKNKQQKIIIISDLENIFIVFWF